MASSLRAHARAYWKHHLALLSATAAAVAVVFGVTWGAKTHTFTVGGPHGTPTVQITVPQAAVNEVKASDVADHEGLKDETPAGASRKVIEAAREQQDKLAASDQLPIVTPDAAPEQRGCTTRLVQNYSSRRGVRPRIFVLHYTVSPNRPGWSDVNAVVSEFDTVAFQASSNYVIDNEGNCAYIVRESDKAWTQAAMNPVAISIEEINTGSEPTYAGTAGLAKIAEVVSDALERWDIPLQIGAVTGGVVTRAGVVDHGMLGVAGGGHHDIAPFSVQKVIDAVATFRAKEAEANLPPTWYLRAAKLDPMWAWFAWRDQHHPAAWRPRNIPARVPQGWWARYTRHVGKAH